MNNIPYFASKFLKPTFKNKLHEIASIKYGTGIKYVLIYMMYDLFNKIYYVTIKNVLNGHCKNSHEIRSIKCGRNIQYSLNQIQQENLEKCLMSHVSDTQYLLKTFQQGTNKKKLKRTFEKCHMKSDPSSMVLACRFC